MNTFLSIVTILLLISIHSICLKCYKLISKFKTDTQPTASIPAENNIQQEIDTLIKSKENPLKYPDKFSLQTFFASSKAEKIIYEYFRASLADCYTIIPHTSLTDIFHFNETDDEKSNYSIYKFLGYHVDFTIFDQLYHPIMSIEVNGKDHKENSYVMWKDTQKKTLFNNFKIPLISLDLSNQHPDEDLPRLLREEISKSKHITYCWKCNTPINCHIENKDYIIPECPNCKKRNIPVKMLFKD